MTFPKLSNRVQLKLGERVILKVEFKTCNFSGKTKHTSYKASSKNLKCAEKEVFQSLTKEEKTAYILNKNHLIFNF